MKKCAISLLLCSLVWNMLLSQSTFQKRLVLENPDYSGLIVQLPNGNFIVSGTGLSSLGFIQLTCLSNNGDIIWGKKYRSAFGSSFVQDMVANSNNEVTILFQTLIDTAFSAYNDRLALLKIDANGQVIWEIRLGDEELWYHNQQDVVVVPGEGYLVGYASYHGFNPANPDFRIARVNEGGGVVWAKQYDTGGDEFYFDFFRTSDGNYLLSYYLNTHPSLPGGCFMHRLDPLGNPISNLTFKDFCILSIDEFSNGDLLLAGSDNGIKNVFARVNSQGQPIWAKSLKAAGLGFGLGEALVTPDDKILLNFSSGGGSRPLVILDGNGNMEWSRADLGNYGGTNEAIATQDGGFALVASALGSNGQAAIYVQKTDANGQVAGCETFLPCIALEDVVLEPGPSITLNVTDVAIDTTLHGTVHPLAVTAEDYCEPLVLPLPDFTATDTVCVGDCIMPTGLQQQQADTWQWSFGGLTPDMANAQDPGEACANIPGDFILKQVISYAGCLDSFSLPITVLPVPRPSLGPDTLLCEATSFQLDATTPGAIEYLWEDQSDGPVREVAASGIYSVTAASSHCAATDTVAISFFAEQYPPDSLDLGPDTTLCDNFTLLLNASVPGHADYTWGDGEQGSTRTVSESGTYGVTATVQGCAISDEITVVITNCEGRLYVPSAFSPNGNGINEFFEAFGKDVEILSLKVFHRWGGLAFVSSEGQLKWDGKTKGRPAEPGVYTYVLEYRDLIRSGRQLMAGEVVLVR